MSRSRLSPFAWWTLLTYSSAWAPNWRFAMSRLSVTSVTLLLLGPWSAAGAAGHLGARPTGRLPARPSRDPTFPGGTPRRGAAGNATSENAELAPRLLRAHAPPRLPPFARHQSPQLANALSADLAPRLERTPPRPGPPRLPAHDRLRRDAQELRVDPPAHAELTPVPLHPRGREANLLGGLFVRPGGRALAALPGLLRPGLQLPNAAARLRDATPH